MSEAGLTGEAVIVIARDLLISSRIITTAKRLGAPLRLVREPKSFDPATPARLLIVDLDLDGAMEAAMAWSRAHGKAAAGFVQHVNTDRIREARSAGVAPIIPRSRLEAALPELLNPRPLAG